MNPKFSHWITILGIAGVLLAGGCAKKTYMEKGQELPRQDIGSASEHERGGGPLKGFSRTPSEERLGSGSGPSLVAKAVPDQGSSEGASRRAGEAGREGNKKQLGDIYFAFDRWGLSDEAMKFLAENAEYLHQNPSVKVIIEGHCDERGSSEYNLILGEKRAREVRQYLSSLGINNPVSVNSYGKERPVCTEHDESCYWKNRRAHLVLSE